MIARANALRHRLLFACWTTWLRLQLRRRGATLELHAPHGARMDSWPHVDLHAGVRSLRVVIGAHVDLGRATHLDLHGADNALEIGDHVYLMHGVRLQLRGGSIRIGPHSHVRDGAVLKSDGDLRVGEEVTIGYGDVIACTESIAIGDRCGLGERVTITDSDHTHDGTLAHYLRQPLKITPVVLGENVLVSANVVITRGARIGDGATIGANAVVTAGEYPGGRVYVGAPAKPRA